MIVRVGTDIVDTRRIERSLLKFGERFQHRILSEGELRTLQEKELAAYVARQFAAKEAVSKVLGSGMRQGVTFKSIHVYRDEDGAPYVSLEDGAKKVADAIGITQIHISLSDERHYALAFAVGVNDPQS